MIWKVTRLAQVDLRRIAAYTERTWGERQAQEYLGGLEAAFQLLARNPEIGREMAASALGRRLEQGSHVIFNREIPQGILIRRVLHKSMLPSVHPL